jgi:hypothetical protein
LRRLFFETTAFCTTRGKVAFFQSPKIIYTNNDYKFPSTINVYRNSKYINAQYFTGLALKYSNILLKYSSMFDDQILIKNFNKNIINVSLYCIVSIFGLQYSYKVQKIYRAFYAEKLRWKLYSAIKLTGESLSQNDGMVNNF